MEIENEAQDQLQIFLGPGPCPWTKILNPRLEKEDRIQVPPAWFEKELSSKNPSIWGEFWIRHKIQHKRENFLMIFGISCGN